MQSDELKRRISAGRGDALADLVLKNARIVNVFTDEIDTADIAISGNCIVGVGAYHGRKEVDLHGKYVCPGLIDGHIHIESSMLCGPAFEQAVLPHGTTAVVTDPHEISNVAGLEGLDFMLEATKNLTLSVYFMLPSCVPATDLDESGAVLNAEQLRPYYGDPRVLGLAELMNAYGTVRCDPKILQKIRDCTEAGKIVDGHAPLLSAKDLNAYIAAGVQSDHECSNIEEAMEKLRRGQYIMIREGTAAKNMEALMPLFREPYCSRCMLVTDDKHPGDLLDSGHIDSNIRKAIRFQARNDQVVDGYLGPSTRIALNSPDARANGLMLGEQGETVTRIQQLLNKYGYLSSANVTGYYGEVTEKAVKSFQSNNGLTADGSVGRQTMNKLTGSSVKKAGSGGSSGGSGGSKGGTVKGGSGVSGLLSIARSKLGCPYVYGAKGPNAFDCSGFIYYCLNQAGVRQSYLTSAGWRSVGKYTKITNFNSLQAGDIIVVSGHVGIVAGGGKVVDASSSNGRVVERALSSWWRNNFICGWRIFG